MVNHPNVGALRKRLNLNQAQFAARYGLTRDAVRAWEGGRQHPQGGAAVLLLLIEREPETIARILGYPAASSAGMTKPLRPQIYSL